MSELNDIFNGFLPAHNKPLADLTSFNIIHYTQPNEMLTLYTTHSLMRCKEPETYSVTLVYTSWLLLMLQQQ